VFRNAAWRPSGLPSLRGARRGGFSFGVFNNAIYAVARDGSVFRFRPLHQATERSEAGEAERSEEVEAERSDEAETAEEERSEEERSEEERSEEDRRSESAQRNREEWEREASVAPNTAPRVADGEIYFGPSSVIV
jgi:hypothetical protein